MKHEWWAKMSREYWDEPQRKYKIMDDDDHDAFLNQWAVRQQWPYGEWDMLSIGIWWRNYMDFGSHEKFGTKASNSEVRRWIKSGSITINDERPRELDYIVKVPVIQLTFFGTGKKLGKIHLI